MLNFFKVSFFQDYDELSKLKTISRALSCSHSFPSEVSVCLVNHPRGAPKLLCSRAKKGTQAEKQFTHQFLSPPVDEDPVLPTRPHELRTRMYTPPGPLSNALRGALTDRFSVAQHHNFLKGYQLHNSYMDNEHFCRWKGAATGVRLTWFCGGLGQGI